MPTMETVDSALESLAFDRKWQVDVTNQLICLNEQVTALSRLIFDSFTPAIGVLFSDLESRLNTINGVPERPSFRLILQDGSVG